MGIPSLPYWHPRLYKLSEFPRGGRRQVRERIRELIGLNKQVFDAAAIFGELHESLDPSCTYTGIDNIAHMARYAKRHGLDVRVEDPAGNTPFPQSDVVVAIDRLHHVTYEQAQRILAKALEAAPLVLVVEPTLMDMAKRWYWDWFFRAFDNNGVNPCLIWYTKEQYMAELPTIFGQRHHDISVDIEEIGTNLLAIYRRK